MKMRQMEEFRLNSKYLSIVETLYWSIPCTPYNQSRWASFGLRLQEPSPIEGRNIAAAPNGFRRWKFWAQTRMTMSSTKSSTKDSCMVVAKAFPMTLLHFSNDLRQKKQRKSGGGSKPHVATQLWPSVRLKLTLPKLGTWSPLGLPNL
jgi:hypothetical protein